MSRYPTLALAALLGTATLALAQAPQPQSSFFAPKPGDDPSLTHTLPPETYPGAPHAAAPAPTAAVVPAPLAVPAPAAPPPGMTTTTVTTTGHQPAAVESAMDRSEAEARRAQEAAARAPQRINGAFTGLTDEADR